MEFGKLSILSANFDFGTEIDEPRNTVCAPQCAFRRPLLGQYREREDEVLMQSYGR